jgi:site-specific recombinase XerD
MLQGFFYSRRWFMAKKKIKLADAVQGYMLRCQSKKLSIRTREWYEQKLTCFCKFAASQLKVTDLASVTLWHLRSFVVAVQEGKAGAITLQARKNERVSDLTVKGYVQVLKGFFNWCLNEELIKSNPAAKLENPKVASYIIPTFDESQIDSLLAACDLKTPLGYRDYTMMLLLLDTGIRLSELCGLRLEDIHRNYIRVFGKGDKEREVGVSPDVAQYIWKYVNKYRDADSETERHVFLNRYGKPLTDSGIAQTIADIGKRAGLSGVRVSPHTFRHTYAVMYLDNGGDVYKLSRTLGHSEIGTTEEYLKNFKSRDARKDHDTYSPVSRLKGRGSQRKTRTDGLFD